jgi:hypothetical protein
VACRGSELYCNELCAEPARLEAKRRWWHRNRGRGATRRPPARDR